MDNVTHTLAGLLLAESAVQLRWRISGVTPTTRFRRIAAVSSAIAANLPDSDIFYTGWHADHLSYLLNHRGHTHTVVIGLIIAALVWLATLLIWRWRAGERASSVDSRWLAGLLVIAVLSHLVLDWTNSYGVHPFWPFNNNWYYGDAVFIVEPWLWVVAIPTLVLASPSRISRALLSLILLAVLGLAWWVELVSVTGAALLSFGTLLSITVARSIPARRRIVGTLLGWTAVTLLMAASSSSARDHIRADFRTNHPASMLLDVVLSPLPANAVCLTAIAVDRTGDHYRVTLGRASALPWLIPANQCTRSNHPSELFTPSIWPSSAAVQWDFQWSASVTALRDLARTSCPALAGLRFMRVPVWAGSGEVLIMGDARYGGGSGSSFSDLVIPRYATLCPASIPPWIPPRAELLGEE